MVSFVARRLHTGAGCRVAQARVPLLVTARILTPSKPTFSGHKAIKFPPCSCSVSLKANRRNFAVVNAWGDDIQWSPAKIVKSRQAAKGHHTLVLEVGSEATRKYEKPGQYLQVRLQGSKPGFFAIASSPASSKDGLLELLVRQRGETAELLCSSQEGTEVEASPIGGPGFKIEKAGPEEAQNLFMFATGSGISPIKALIESGALQAGKRRKVKLFWGTHDADSTAYKDNIPEWEAAGVQVVPVYSSDGNGYVQDVFQKENEIQDGSTVGVILCGHKEMCQAIAQQMEAVGVSNERILLNF